MNPAESVFQYPYTRNCRHTHYYISLQMQPHDLSNGSQPPADSMPEDPTITLLESYNSLNPSTITTLTTLPSPLEFLRFVAQNRPFVIRGGASDWKAVKEWNVASLKEILEGVSVNVAVTPIGYESSFSHCSIYMHDKRDRPDSLLWLSRSVLSLRKISVTFSGRSRNHLLSPFVYFRFSGCTVLF